MAPASTRTPVYEEWDDIDGIPVVVVADEAFLPDEYDRMAKRCPQCHRRFLFYSEEQGAHRAPTRYCSDNCTQITHRQMSRERMRRQRATNQLELELAS